MKNIICKPFTSYYLPLLGMLALVLFASCSSTNADTQLAVQQDTVPKPKAEETYNLTTTQFESSGMELGKIEMFTFHDIVEATGMLDVPPENRVTVSSYFGGTVKSLRLLPGEAVKKGQWLFTLENPEFVQIQQDFLAAKGKLLYLQADYERQKNLAQDNIASQKSFLKAESDYTVTRVRMESLKKQLGLMNINPATITLNNLSTTINIYSPIDGYVTEVGINTGAFLNPSETAITIVDTDHLHLELNIFEKNLAKIAKGQSIHFTIQEESSQEYEATVHLINKSIDPINRTIGIHGHLLDESLSSKLVPGMYVEADIYSTSTSKASLPLEALVEVEGKYYVLVLQNTTNEGYSLVKREVKTGVSNNERIEIVNTEDFNQNASFLTKGAFNLITV